MSLADHARQTQAAQPEREPRRFLKWLGRIFARRPSGVCSCGYSGPLDNVQPSPELGSCIGDCPRCGSTREAR